MLRNVIACLTNLPFKIQVIGYCQEEHYCRNLRENKGIFDTVFNIANHVSCFTKGHGFFLLLSTTIVKNRPCINSTFSVSLCSPPPKCDYISYKKIGLDGWEPP